MVILGSGSWARPVSETVIFQKSDYTICSLLSGTDHPSLREQGFNNNKTNTKLKQRYRADGFGVKIKRTSFSDCTPPNSSGPVLTWVPLVPQGTANRGCPQVRAILLYLGLKKNSSVFLQRRVKKTTHF